MPGVTAHPIATSEYHQRLACAQRAIAAAGMDGAVFLEYANVVYLSGFHHASNERPVGMFVPVAGEPTLFVPLLEQEHAASAWMGALEVYPEFPGRPHPVVWMAQRSGLRRLGFDAIDIRVAQAVAALGVAPVACDAVERLRWVKSEAEMALIRTAARFADRCLEHLLASAGGVARAGGSEIDILEAALSATRADMAAALGNTFEGSPTRVVGTVHSGPQAALPHGRPGDRRPAVGEVLIAGIGVAVGGYHAESGATFTFGEANDDQRRCLAAAAACDRAARAACVIGVSGEQVNDAGHAALIAAGLGDTIRHRVGHGMGLQGHESPWLAPGGGEPVALGMVFSNEPGIYRPGIDGYRTINTMVVGPTGVEVPSRFQAEHPIEQRVLR